MLFRFSLRLGRWGIAGYGAFAFLITLLQTTGFYQLAGHTPAERAAFGRSMSVLANEFTVIIQGPLRPDTVGGYVQWRAYGFIAIVIAIWALASGTGAARGDEERGLTEAVLATGTSRADALLARFAAFAAASVVAAAAAAAGLYAGLDRARESVDPGAVLTASALVVGLALSCFALTVLISQLVAARLAAATAGIVLLGLFLANSLGRTLDWLRPWRWLSPFYYYDLSRPLAPGGDVDVRAIEVLFAIAVVAMVAAILAFAFRDLGAPLIRIPTRKRHATYDSSHLILWRVPVARGLHDRRAGLLAWAAGMAVLAALFVVLTRSIVQPLLGITQLAPYFRSIIHGQIYTSFLGVIWFGFAELLFAGYAITQVARWSAEDGDGRLEMTLSQPVSRTGIVAERTALLLVSLALLAAVGAVALKIESQVQSIDVNAQKLAEASLLLVPFGMFFAAVGAVMASRIPRATVGLLAAYAIASYFISQLGPVFKWPGWTLNLSPFKLFDDPLTNGVDSAGLAIMLAVVVFGLGVSAWLTNRRDVGS
jgi:ABC-2 type transport system permease protein